MPPLGTIEDTGGDTGDDLTDTKNPPAGIPAGGLLLR